MPTDHDIHFDKILELALKDKLVLWAGAGLSREETVFLRPKVLSKYLDFELIIIR